MTTALVTGASSGIGEQLARELARRGYDLILVARRKQRLEDLSTELAAVHRVDVQVWVEDLSDAEAPARIERRLAALNMPLHLLVNNAGVGYLGSFHEVEPETESRMLLLNVHALSMLTRLLLPHLIASRGRGILNVASTASFQPVPRMASYAATKAYVLSFSEALRAELAPLGINVTALCPGATRTDFISGPNIEKTKLARRLARPEDVARAGLDGLLRGRAIVMPDLRDRLLVFSARLAPRAAVVRISGGLTTHEGERRPRLRAPAGG
ncbi:MAG TPA: SDR family oxidoreductase [Polyangiales bacterium]